MDRGGTGHCRATPEPSGFREYHSTMRPPFVGVGVDTVRGSSPPGASSEMSSGSDYTAGRLFKWCAVVFARVRSQISTATVVPLDKGICRDRGCKKIAPESASTSGGYIVIAKAIGWGRTLFTLSLGYSVIVQNFARYGVDVVRVT